MPAEATVAPHARVRAALAIAVIAISFAAIFFREAAPTHPLVIAGARLSIASILLAPFVVRAWRRGALPRRTALAAAIAGVLYGVHFGTWVSSLELTSVASSVTLVTATPLLLAVIGLASRTDRPTGRHWLALGLATLGVTLIGWGDLSTSRDALIGDGLALAGAAAMAAYLLIVRRLGEPLDVLAFGGVACAVGALALLVSGALAGVPLEVARGTLPYIALAALFPQLVGHSLLTWSLRHASPTEVGLATVGEPVGATILAWVILDETPAPIVLVGCAATLAAVVFALTRGAPRS
ncbi:MAG: DMT family transporter [Sandaracinaceae bacterium]